VDLLTFFLNFFVCSNQFTHFFLSSLNLISIFNQFIVFIKLTDHTINLWNNLLLPRLQWLYFIKNWIFSFRCITSSFFITINISITSVEFIVDLVNKVVFSFKIFIIVSIAQGLNCDFDIILFLVKVVNLLLKILKTFLHSTDLGLALLVVIIELILQWLYAETFKGINVSSNTWNINLVLLLKCFQVCLESLQIFRADQLIISTLSIILNVLRFF